ncbi:MAG TPA: hypothetical protein VNK82_08680 [Terriglobales bacterium]|nr:hypothetical protein [Terriglobales bacterium]
MTLFSALEDFLKTTLSRVPGRWSKLVYVAGLREQGRYRHWGLERVHGEPAVQDALQEVHQSLFLEVLRTPLPELLEDAEQSAVEQELEAEAYVNGLGTRREALLPSDLGGGSARHFNAVLSALSSLVQGHPRASR